MSTRIHHNPLRLVTEILAAVARCQENKVNATIGEVHLHLINIVATRKMVEDTLIACYEWGLLERFQWNYRPNKRATRYELSGRFEAVRLNRAIIRYCDDVASHFPGLTKKGQDEQ